MFICSGDRSFYLLRQELLKRRCAIADIPQSQTARACSSLLTMFFAFCISADLNMLLIGIYGKAWSVLGRLLCTFMGDAIRHNILIRAHTPPECPSIRNHSVFSATTSFLSHLRINSHCKT